MLLVFNTIITEKYKIAFDKQIVPSIFSNISYKIMHFGGDILEQFQNNENEFSGYTHLLLSGSSLSASQGSKYDQDIIKVIRYFLYNNKAMLGICHGHQMIARAIIGNSACRKAQNPEFGWKKMKIESNSLFEGISNPVFLESHYDEVCNLTDEFNVIATNKDCEVQAFQYKDLPVWGVQFHPEMQFENGSEMVEDHIKDNPQDKQFYKNELISRDQIDQNFQIFRNFISTF